jgi:hypothetical protein
MDIKELIGIIKKEKLYEYSAFIIGLPEQRVAWAIESYGDTEGIFQQENGMWRLYWIERWSIDRIGPYEYDEDGVCKALLESMRFKKELHKSQHRGKLHFYDTKLDID